MTLLGHGYFADARDLLQDMHDLLLHNTEPEKRFGLKAVSGQNSEQFWRIGK